MLLRAVHRPLPPRPAPIPELPPWPEALLPYIPAAIRARLAVGQTGWLAELRSVSVLFVNLPGLAEPAVGALGRVQQIMQALPSQRFETFRHQ